MSKIKSPCVNICRYNSKGCTACLRTIEEITNWTSYSDQEREKIMKRIREEKLQNSNSGDYYGFP